MNTYIVRRNDWGKPSCDYILQGFPELKVVNKDKQEMPNDADWIIRWATTNTLIAQDEMPKVVNTAQAIHKVFNKGGFRYNIAKKNLAPKTWISLDDWYHDGSVIPVIVRPWQHSASEELHYCTTKDQVKAVVSGYWNTGRDFYISEFIDKEAEYRVFLVNSRVVAIARKYPKDPDSVTWGINEVWEYVGWNDWNLKMLDVAVKAFNMSNLHVGAVDIISKGDKHYCLEVNSGPLMSPYYGKQIGKALKWLVENDHRQSIPTANSGDWKSYIHPALHEGAVY